MKTILVFVLIWPLQSKATTESAIVHLRHAQDALISERLPEMMNHVFTTMREAGQDPVINKKAMEFARIYFQQHKPQPLFELPKDLVEPWVTVTSYYVPGKPLFYTLQMSLKTLNPNKIRKIMISTPDGRTISVLGRDTYTETFASKLAGHFVVRAWSQPQAYLPAGLYDVSLWLEGDEPIRFPVPFQPATREKEMPDFTFDRTTRMVTWKSPEPKTVLPQLQPLLWLQLFPSGEPLPIASATPALWDLSRETLNQQPTRTRLETRRRGPHDFVFAYEFEIKLGEMKIVHEYITSKPIEL